MLSIRIPLGNIAFDLVNLAEGIVNDVAKVAGVNTSSAIVIHLYKI